MAYRNAALQLGLLQYYSLDVIMAALGAAVVLLLGLRRLAFGPGPKGS